MSLTLRVGLAGAAGAVCRYLVGIAYPALADALPLTLAWNSPSQTLFPVGTLFVNLTGSWLLGLAWSRVRLSESVRLPITAGFLGAYTTFSTWTVETLRLWTDGHFGLAAANIGVSLALGLPAVWAGLRFGQLSTLLLPARERRPG